MARKQTWPEEGDLLVCIVKSVSDKGAYLEIDGLDGVEGFVFIGEVAAGWVKSVRSHLREGQRVVAKAIGVKQDRGRIDLSIKSETSDSNFDLESLIFKCLGPEASAVIKGKLTSVCGAVESSILAFSAASFNL